MNLIGYAAASPLIVTARRRSLSFTKLASFVFAYAGFGNGLNIHRKWVCRASHVAPSTGSSRMTSAIRPNQRPPIHNLSAIARRSSEANTVSHGDQRRMRYEISNTRGVWALKGMMRKTGISTITSTTATSKRSISQTSLRLIKCLQFVALLCGSWRRPIKDQQPEMARDISIDPNDRSQAGLLRQWPQFQHFPIVRSATARARARFPARRIAPATYIELAPARSRVRLDRRLQPNDH